jgi:hypothetical protein
MKKALYVLLAALTIIGMVSCGGGGGSSTTPTVTTVSFDWNFPADFDDDGIETPDAVEVTVGDGIGTLPTSPVDPVTDGIVMVNWNTKIDGSGDVITSASTFTVASITLYAQWEEYDPVKVTFDIGSGAWTADNSPTNPVVTKHINLAFGGDLPGNPFKDQFVFAGWSTTNGTENPDIGVAVVATTKVATLDPVPATQPETGKVATVYARFTAAPVPVGFSDASKAIPGAGEYADSANANFPAYKFTLPAGATWGDYDHIELEIQPLGNLAFFKTSNSARSIRLFGPVRAADFQLLKMKTTVFSPLVDRFAVIHFGSASNAWILNTQANWGTIDSFLTGSTSNGGYKLVQMIDDPDSEDDPPAQIIDPPGSNAGDVGKYVKAGAATITPGASNISIAFPIDGTGKDNAYNCMPHAKDSGPFYFGLGISGPGDFSTKSMVKSVKLVKKSGSTVTDVVGEAAYFKEGADTDLYPAFFGYDGTKTENEGTVWNYSDGGSQMDIVYRGETAPVYPVGEKPKDPATADLAVLANGNSVNTTAFTGGYDGTHGISIPFTFPTDLNISSYKDIAISVQASTTDNTTFVDVTANSQVQFDFVNAAGDKVGSSQYNVLTTGYSVSIPQGIKDVASTVTGINIYNADANIKYIKVITVTLIKP